MDAYDVYLHCNWLAASGKPWKYHFRMTWGGTGIDDPILNEDDLSPEEFVFSPGWEQPFIDWWKTIHINQAYLNRIVVSTLRKDTRNTPGDPEDYGATEVKTVSVGINGTRGAGVFGPASLTQTLFARKEVLSGRQGRLTLRGVLIRDDIIADILGEDQLDPDSPVATEGALWTTALGFLETANYIGQNSEYAGLTMVVGGGQDDDTILDFNLRPVQTLLAVGVKPRRLENNDRMTGFEKARRLIERQGGTVTVPGGA